MMFKNETTTVARKAQKRYEALAMLEPQPNMEPKGRRPSDARNPEPAPMVCRIPSHSTQPHPAPTTRYPTPESMTMEITPSIEDQAMGFFISNHVSQPTLVPRGQYEWLLEALNQPDCAEIVRSSANAASLAGLANATKCSAIKAKACAAYGSALRMTNDALRVRETAVKDSTLISVIMLGLYENTMFHDKRSVQAWAKHVQGASALFNLRGKEQFESDTARRIFHQYYGIIILCSLEGGQPMADGIRELYDHCNPGSNYAVHGRLWTTRLTNFLHDAVNLNRDKVSDPVAMVTKAINLDRELDSIKSLMPKIWQYETVRLEQPLEYAYGTFYHIYMDPWIAQMWNNLRSCRLYLYRVIREQLWKGRACNPPLFSQDEVEPQTAAAEKVIRTTIVAICASAPQLTGMVDFPQWPAPTTPTPHDRLQPPGTFLDPSRPTCMYHLIWPLYAAGTSDLSNSEMRRWIIDMLYFIALRIGTRQAVVLADSMKEMETSTAVSRGG